MGLTPTPRRQELPIDERRRHTLESRDERKNGRRMRTPPEESRGTLVDARRDRTTWNADDQNENPRRLVRRDGGDPRRIQTARECRLKSTREKSTHTTTRSPHGKDSCEAVSSRDKHLRDQPLRGEELHTSHSSDPLHKRDPRRKRDQRGKEQRNRDRREKNQREKNLEGDPWEKECRNKDLRIRDPRERDRLNRDREGKDLRERDRRERDPRPWDARERLERYHTLHEQDQLDDFRREKSPLDFPGRGKRRNVATTESKRNFIDGQMQRQDHSLAKRASSNHHVETASTCGTSTSTLNNLYAALNSNEDIRAQALPSKPKSKRSIPCKEKENQSAFADSTFSIFSLAGSDHSDSESKSRNKVAKKTSSRRNVRSQTKSSSRETIEKKEHLDFSASSSSVKSFEMSEITKKYLNPKPIKAAMQHTSLRPMVEENGEREESSANPSRRKAHPKNHTSERKRNAIPSYQREHNNKVRGVAKTDAQAAPLFRPVDVSFRDSSEILKGSTALSAFKSGTKSSRTLTISNYGGFDETRFSLRSNVSNGDDTGGDSALVELRAASNLGKEDSTARRWAKKAAIAGIDPASLRAKQKAKTTANYKLTKKDQVLMQQISEEEAILLQHQQELLDLLDMYSEATKRAQKAQTQLQKAKERVARYKRAHGAVTRAIRSGKLLMKQKEYMAAILELSHAIGIERSNATLWYMLAECRLMISQYAAAEEACMQSLKLQPTGAAVVMLGRIMHKRGRHDEAIQCYLSALGRNNESEDEDECM
ncbi:hypothetical protein PsorP6_004721 [Peronosclerospora sorghi]|uniref:Uncharacterized protein n=1 Tax=Peronosclerospora sorghi TaxID=230839 RepID=A0ACC0VL98_9STRA|nr:hypothetical protein PsorP6_004721 [Peronosclerospora sorghi]